MRDAVIVSTARTPIGKAYRGAFNDTQAQMTMTLTMAGLQTTVDAQQAQIEAQQERITQLEENEFRGGGVPSFTPLPPQAAQKEAPAPSDGGVESIAQVCRLFQ